LGDRGLPGWVFLVWKPWAVLVSALTYPPCEMTRLVAGTKFLDAALLQRARAAGKPVADLEGFAEQLGTIAAVPEAVQIGLLKGTLKLEPLQADLHETMVRLYLQGRVGTLLGLSKALVAEVAPGQDFDPFWTGLLDTRNRRMVANALPLVADGNAFIAVGAGHLIGRTGLVAGLRAAGYRVEPLR
ncbi:TraB/GumN family protein, partial [Mycobacterium tuberculosis]|nr:TraB/GumN family protein [Mycobacterium tuberculosis]